MPTDQSDTVTTNDKKNLQTAHAALTKLLADVEKAADKGDKNVVTARSEVDNVGKAIDNITVARSPRADLAPVQKRLVALQKGLKQLAQQAKSASKGWTVTVNKDVAAFAKKATDKKFDLAVTEIGKFGVDAAGGVRKVNGKVYDVHSGSSSDNRYVGIADPGKQSFEFLGVYKHAAKGGGKQLVEGKAVPGY